MKERYAADWEKSLEDFRHKGVRIGTLWAKWDGVSGDVTLTDDFSNETGLFRADVLKDVIGLLEREYEVALKKLLK